MYVTFKIRHVASLSELTKEHTFSPLPAYPFMSAAVSVTGAGSFTLHSQTLSLLAPTPSLATVSPLQESRSSRQKFV